jgi:hypothetical protein
MHKGSKAQSTWKEHAKKIKSTTGTQRGLKALDVCGKHAKKSKTLGTCEECSKD